MSCHSVWCEGVVGAPVRVECLPHRALPKQPALRLGPPYRPWLHRTVQYPSHVAGLTTERVHNARHKNVTSALNTTFFKTSGL